MPTQSVPPLTSTVSSVFTKFLERLKEEKVINAVAQNALAECLSNQKLDPDALREAIYTADEPTK